MPLGSSAAYPNLSPALMHNLCAVRLTFALYMYDRLLPQPAHYNRTVKSAMSVPCSRYQRCCCTCGRERAKPAAQGGEYGCWVGGGSFTQVFSSQVRPQEAALMLGIPHVHGWRWMRLLLVLGACLEMCARKSCTRKVCCGGRPCNKIYWKFVFKDSCPGCEQDAAYGGWDGARTNAEGILHSHDGKLWINLPGQTTLVFKQEV